MSEEITLKTNGGPGAFFKCGSLVGDWEVVVFIARGGCGEIYRVKHVRTGTTAVLKVLYKDDDMLRERFILESDILQRMASYVGKGTAAFPHFLERGSDKKGKHPYVVIEELKAFELPETDIEVAAFMKKMCVAMSELHANGFLHRDLKPSNVMCRNDGEPVIIDFGLAARIEEVSSQFSKRISFSDGVTHGVGTIGSSAPEQIIGESSIRSDVYSLGALASDCFNGQPPASWQAIIQRATNPRPEFRYKDPHSFAKAISRRFITVKAAEDAEKPRWMRNLGRLCKITLLVAPITTILVNVPSFVREYIDNRPKPVIAQNEGEEKVRPVIGSVETVESPFVGTLIRIPGQKYLMGRTEVTQGQWESVMSTNPAYFKGVDFPVECVNWDDCHDFIDKLNGKSEIKGLGLRFRLPTRKEWEYTCTANGNGPFGLGSDGRQGKLTEMGWFVDNSGGMTHPVARLRPNAFGLYDMHGNVWEWCEDEADEGKRVEKGGSWMHSETSCKINFVGTYDPSRRRNTLGLRLVADEIPQIMDSTCSPNHLIGGAENEVSVKSAERLLFGDGVAKNENKAFSIFQVLSNGGDVEAMWHMAICYLRGKGCEKNVQRSVDWLFKSSDGGSSMAKYFLYGLYESGVGVDVDIEKAKQFLIESAQSGNVLAKVDLALCKLKLGQTQFKFEQDVTGGVGLLTEIASKEKVETREERFAVASASCTLSHLYTSGNLVPSNYSEGRKWLVKASNYGNVIAKMQLGVDNLYRDDEDAIRLLKEAAECEDGILDYFAPDLGRSSRDMVKYILSEVLRIRAGDEVGAEYWREKTIEGLAEYVTSGLKRSQRPKISAINRARAWNEQMALWIVGRMALDGLHKSLHVSDALSYLEKSAWLGSKDAANDLGEYYAGGIDHNWIDVDKAAYWYYHGGELGNGDSLANLGEMHEKGVLKTGTNYAEAVRLYECAVKLGSSYGKRRLADCYVKGIGVKQDWVKGVTLAKEAAEVEASDIGWLDLGSNVFLGECYYSGVPGLESDPNKAVNYFRLVLDHGISRSKLDVGTKRYRLTKKENIAAARLGLGRAHFEGRGVEKDLDKATEYLSSAMSDGSKDAEVLLEKVKQSRRRYKE